MECVFIEGGGATIASALEAKLVDKVLFFIAPKIIGGREAVTVVEGRGIDKPGKALRIKDISIRRFGKIS